MMGRLKADGFAVLELLLVAFVLVIIGATGLFVYHSKKAADKLLNVPEPTVSQAAARGEVTGICTSADKILHGHTYTGPGGLYSVCIPDGWTLYYTGSDPKSHASGVIAVTPGMVYKAATKPVVKTTGGKDGASPFALFYNNPALSEPLADYTKVGVFNGQKTSGTEYVAHVTTEADGENYGWLPAGSTSREYVFQHNTASLAVVYNIMPGDRDQSPLVAAIASTVQFVR